MTVTQTISAFDLLPTVPSDPILGVSDVPKGSQPEEGLSPTRRQQSLQAYFRGALLSTKPGKVG
jgi:hypothetical protein